MPEVPKYPHSLSSRTSPPTPSLCACQTSRLSSCVCARCASLLDRRISGGAGQLLAQLESSRHLPRLLPGPAQLNGLSLASFGIRPNLPPLLNGIAHQATLALAGSSARSDKAGTDGA